MKTGLFNLLTTPELKKNSFPRRFACILVPGREGRIHILNFIYSALRTGWLPYLALSATKYIPSLFFLMTSCPASEVS